MKIKNPQIPRLSLRYGAVGGILAMLAFLVFFYLGQQPWRNIISFFLDILIVGLFVFLPIKDFKTNHNGGELRFYQGMTIGFISYAMLAFIFALFYGIFINYVVSDFLETFIASAKSDMQLRKELLMQSVEGDKAAFFKQQLKELEEITRIDLISDAFLKKMLFGIFLTPIFAIILRTPQSVNKVVSKQ